MTTATLNTLPTPEVRSIGHGLAVPRGMVEEIGSPTRRHWLLHLIFDFGIHEGIQSEPISSSEPTFRNFFLRYFRTLEEDGWVVCEFLRKEIRWAASPQLMRALDRWAVSGTAWIVYPELFPSSRRSWTANNADLYGALLELSDWGTMRVLVNRRTLAELTGVPQPDLLQLEFMELIRRNPDFRLPGRTPGKMDKRRAASIEVAVVPANDGEICRL